MDDPPEALHITTNRRSVVTVGAFYSFRFSVGIEPTMSREEGKLPGCTINNMSSILHSNYFCDMNDNNSFLLRYKYNNNMSGYQMVTGNQKMMYVPGNQKFNYLHCQNKVTYLT